MFFILIQGHSLHLSYWLTSEMSSQKDPSERSVINMRTYQDVNFSVSVCACIFQNLQMHVSVLCVSWVFGVWLSWVFRELPTMQWILNERRLLEQILNGAGICVSHSIVQYGMPDTGTLYIVQWCNSFWMVLVYGILDHSMVYRTPVHCASECWD